LKYGRKNYSAKQTGFDSRLWLPHTKAAGPPGHPRYDPSLATSLDAQEVIDLVAELKHDGSAIHAERDFAGNLELIFFLDTASVCSAKKKKRLSNGG
jgi:hypothetical protein